MDELICETCHKLFTPKDKRQKKYCSRECYYKAPRWNKGKKGVQVSPFRHEIYLNCEYCGEPFRVPKYRMETAHFCSRLCQNRWHAQHSKTSEQSPIFKNGSTVAFYRREAFRLFPHVCNRCGSTEKIIVHHRDGNRKNNPVDGSNWEILCRRCHQIHHECSNHLPKVPRPRIAPKYRLKEVKTCVLCGKEYHPYSHEQRFCSLACSNKGRNRL